MKKISASLFFTASILAISQLQAHPDGTVKDAWGKDVTTASGECVVFGNPEPGLCHGMHAKMEKQPDQAPVKMAEPEAATTMAKTATVTRNDQADEEPVVKEVINLAGVVFKTNSDVLDSSSNTRLDTAAQTLMDNPGVKVIVAGHTDSAGDALYNLSLSEKRAQAVRQYLINKGVNGSRLTARGYGETEPYASNDTAAGRAKNRRVELRILE